ncbi:MAG: ATP-binding cassette domain-containing protein [Sulfitobacter sp.]|jgi:putative ABC transport system ATP-binding protein|uniref:ABC transporter ATP-binding protein n=1 Tax=Sulfitobacter sp. TaxID=1903071 RepID=UPI000C0FD70C|nr:ABC transporter [Roseobacter sp.]MBV48979.1 ABC transporter [Roseobacter sp.]PHR06255.1 MAG: ABC transporter [Sulfitobacter sp.]|tara:strand:+ start:7224 stop:7892 length:669 start_codon:yes stop_codon:yes gene_type:complete
MTDQVFQIKDASLKLDSNTGKVDILHGITLEIAQGETVAFTGPSGSGKSSLLMVMGGLEQATGGSVRALGQDLTTMSEDSLAKFRRGRMGIVFQSFHLIPTMTALENVATPLELDGAEDAFERAEAELHAVGLGHRLHHYPAQMSGGEQQRVALARASAPRPAILLADEPTGNLDSVNGAAIMDMLFDLRQKHGATLVLVTHADDLAARCDRVITLTDGRIV